MDELVAQAMARWPDVPAVHGWLRLDRRGRWMLVDRGAPGFDERLHGAGSEITSPQIIAFIGRNYASDDQGRWYWQNGPQRVFVDLEAAPWILRVLGEGESATLVTHTGQPVGEVLSAWRTEKGELLLITDLGPGVVHDLDLAGLDLQESDAPGGPDVLRIAGKRFDVAGWPKDHPLPFTPRPRG